MRQESPVADLLDRAAHGVESAWQEIIRRYSPLVATVCLRYEVTGPDAEDAGSEVWLRLVANLHTIRDPEALPGWLTTTTRNECLMLLRHKKRQLPSDHETDHEIAGENETEAVAELIARERRDAVRLALARLPERDRELLSLLFSDPPTPYHRISAVLGMSVGAIGPTRQRCLARIRRTPEIMALSHDARPVRSHCPAEFPRRRQAEATPVRPRPSARAALHSEGGCDA